jgi:hypothetical protein
VKVDVKLPPGFVSASWEAVPGWSVRAVKQKLSKPVQTDDGPIDEQVGEIVWTAADRKAGIQPGEFRDFPLSVVIPGKAGQTLTFKALQTYSNGSVVRWIGAPDTDEPAPQVKLTAAHPPAGQPAAGPGGGEHRQRLVRHAQHRRADRRRAGAGGRGDRRRDGAGEPLGGPLTRDVPAPRVAVRPRASG